MPFFIVAVILCSQTICSQAIQAESNWSNWRGPQRNGVADANQSVPVKWTKEDVLWKKAIPGRGHGSAIVVGDNVYIASAERDREARSLRCLNKKTGDEVWSTDVHVGNVLPFKNKKGSDASSTPACDGETLFINFLHDDAMWTSAVTMKGEIKWQTKICDYKIHQAFGSSPCLFGNLVIVTADNKLGGAIAGLNHKTGEIVWKKDRPKQPNYSSPIIFEVNDKPQVLLTGCDHVTSYDPKTGKINWEIEGATTECVTTTPLHGNVMFTSGGYPKNHVSAVRCDGTGDVVWENGARVYVPSMFVRGDYLYAVMDAGVAVCWDAKTGKEQWKGRLGGTFSSSPVLVGDTVYAINETGHCFVFKAQPEKFELVAENRVGEDCFSTPTICGGRIYVRSAEQDGDVRREFLYCIGEEK